MKTASRKKTWVKSEVLKKIILENPRIRNDVFWSEKSETFYWSVLHTVSDDYFTASEGEIHSALGLLPGSLQVVMLWWIKALLVLSDENISSFRIETSGSIQLWGDLSAVGNGTFHLRPVTPRDEGPAVISLHYEHTPALFNAAKFRMLVRNTVKVLVSKDFDVLWKPDFPLICMNSLCSIALGRWIFVLVGYNSRHTLRVMGMSGRICILMEKKD